MLGIASGGKRHDSVLRAFDAMQVDAEYRHRNFAETVEMRENPSGGRLSSAQRSV